MFMQNEYFFLSNMYPCEVTYNGHTFQNSEAAYQAQKDLSRVSEFEGITGKESKRLGRHVKMRPDWDSVKLEIMEDILRAKFSNPELAKKLKAVNVPIVEETTWHDTYWGVCDGRGQNNLGKILTKIKNDLQKADKKKLERTLESGHSYEEDVVFNDVEEMMEWWEEDKLYRDEFR